MGGVWSPRAVAEKIFPHARSFRSLEATELQREKLTESSLLFREAMRLGMGCVGLGLLLVAEFTLVL